MSLAPLNKARSAGLKYGWRSGLEEAVGAQLTAAKTAFTFEALAIPYVPLKLERKYTPDFILSNGIVVETKGRFETDDRQKIKAILQQYPDLDLRMVFSRSAARISKTSKTTYAMWCTSHGIPFADKRIPAEWLKEADSPRSLAVLAQLKQQAKK